MRDVSACVHQLLVLSTTIPQANPVEVSAQAIELKLGHVYETGHPIHTASVEAAEYFGECTGGAYWMQVYPASQLGKETALNEQIRSG